MQVTASELGFNRETVVSWEQGTYLTHLLHGSDFPLFISPHCPEADLYLEGSMKEFKQAFQRCGPVLVALLLPGSSVHGIL